MNENEKYDGEYKVEISDKGRISFDLNWKWLLGISISIIGFVSYLLIDEYFIEPMDKLKKENIELKLDLKNEKSRRVTKEEEYDNIFKVLDQTQKLLVSKTDMTYSIVMKLVPENNSGMNVNNIIPISGNAPGSSE